MTLQNNTYSISHTSLSTTTAGCACACGQRKREINKEKEIWSVHQQHCWCIRPVGVDLELFTPLSTQSLGMVCVNFCVWLWARGTRVCVCVCQYVCCRVTHVEADRHTECINTSVCACVFAMRVCVPIRAALFQQILQVMPLVLGVKLSVSSSF